MLSHLYPNATITCVDPWEPHLDNVPRDDMDEIEARFDTQMETLVDDHVARVTKIKGRSARVLSDLLSARRTFDVVYVDGSHALLPALADVLLSWQLVTPGGLAIFDDYGWTGPIDDELERPTKAYDFFLAEVLDASEECTTLMNGGQLFCRKGPRPAAATVDFAVDVAPT